MNYHNQVRQLVDQAIRRGQTGELIRHQIGIDERHDPTLVAMRVYGNRQDYDVVMLMVGTNAISGAAADQGDLLAHTATADDPKKTPWLNFLKDPPQQGQPLKVAQQAR